MQRTVSPRVAGGRCRCARQASAMRVGMSPGGRKAGSSASTTRVRTAGCGGRRVEQALAEVVGPPQLAQATRCSSHRPITLRRKRIVASTPPSLVKFASRAASVQHRRVELDADQRPGARGDVGEGRAGGRRHRDDGGGGVVRPDRDDRRRGGQPGGFRDVGPEPPDQLAGLPQRRLGKLGSFDFNSRFYADDDLIVGRPLRSCSSTRRPTPTTGTGRSCSPPSWSSGPPPAAADPPRATRRPLL